MVRIVELHLKECVWLFVDDHTGQFDQIFFHYLNLTRSLPNAQLEQLSSIGELITKIPDLIRNNDLSSSGRVAEDVHFALSELHKNGLLSPLRIGSAFARRKHEKIRLTSYFSDHFFDSTIEADENGTRDDVVADVEFSDLGNCG